MKTKLLTFVTLAFIGLSTANAQVGIGTDTPEASAELDVESTTKGFLPPRLTTTERGDITSPAVGLTIYNKEVNCLQWFNGSGWYNACEGSVDLVGSGFTNGFEDNTTCSDKVISVTSCAEVSGATINNDTGTVDGIEYDWPDATSYMGGTSTAALVEIGGQCWFKRNSTTPSPYTGTNDFDGFYNNATSEPALGEGRLYQWSAAMNGSDVERAQGVCPTGWHVPSDCEWMYLESTLGMTVADQEITGFRNSGTVGTKLKSGGSSGFTALLAGGRLANGSFFNRGPSGYLWSSSETSATAAHGRHLNSSQAGVSRFSNTKANGISVRCLKD